jgi:hypothetical protein
MTEGNRRHNVPQLYRRVRRFRRSIVSGHVQLTNFAGFQVKICWRGIPIPRMLDFTAGGIGRVDLFFAVSWAQPPRA